MMKYISNLFGKGKEPKNDFSDFFRNAPISEKKKLFKEVVSQANKDQRQIIERAKTLDHKLAQ